MKSYFIWLDILDLNLPLWFKVMKISLLVSGTLGSIHKHISRVPQSLNDSSSFNFPNIRCSNDPEPYSSLWIQLSSETTRKIKGCCRIFIIRKYGIAQLLPNFAPYVTLKVRKTYSSFKTQMFNTGDFPSTVWVV